MTLELTSRAFEQGQSIPTKHAYKGEGDNLSPPLAWSGAPEGTQSFALICDDPDAPSPLRPRPKPWVHWVVYDLPAGLASLDEGGNGGGVEGTTDFGEKAYGGPMPPPGSGTHRYFFKLYALDATLGLDPGASKADLLAAMEGHVLAEVELFGTYERS